MRFLGAETKHLIDILKDLPHSHTFSMVEDAPFSVLKDSINSNNFQIIVIFESHQALHNPSETLLIVSFDAVDAVDDRISVITYICQSHVKHDLKQSRHLGPKYQHNKIITKV